MIGIIPCAGQATRLHGLPKYLLPVGDSYLLAILVRRMQAAGVKHVYIGANRDNYDLISQYAPDGCTVYLCNTKTMSETILAARKYAGDEDVIFAMPDTWWRTSGLDRLYGVLKSIVNPAVVGLFKARPEQKSNVGMCEIDAFWHITDVVDKPKRTDYEYLWGCIAWKPSFWQYIQASDATIGYALKRAIDAGEAISGEPYLSYYYDCGVADQYFQLIRDTTEVEHATI